MSESDSPCQRRALAVPGKLMSESREEFIFQVCIKENEMFVRVLEFDSEKNAHVLRFFIKNVCDRKTKIWKPHSEWERIDRIDVCPYCGGDPAVVDVKGTTIPICNYYKDLTNNTIGEA
jgi:hypothetical protein